MPETLEVKARVDHGRWLADCPLCNGAELVSPGKPFRCQSKPCVAVAHVTWPTSATQARIEALLALRPDPATRNWRPRETLKALAAENAAHGLPTKGTD